MDTLNQNDYSLCWSLSRIITDVGLYMHGLPNHAGLRAYNVTKVVRNMCA